MVVSHGELASAFVDAVQRITGQDGALVAVSNEGCDRDGLLRALTDAVGSGPAVLFVDLPSGSCLQAAARYVREHADVAVVCGVNLAMLIDFVYHRDLTPAAAADRAAATGARSLTVWDA